MEAMSFMVKLGLSGLLGVLAMSLSAKELPPTALLSIGFAEVRLSDLENTPHYDKRAIVAGNYLRATADFNGDGTPDEAGILQNRDRQIAYIVALISTPEKLDTYILSSFPLPNIPHIAIEAVKPQPDVTDGQMRAGLAIFDLRTGKGEAKFFDGEEFGVATPVDRPDVLGS